jgi:hypothetical protein
MQSGENMKRFLAPFVVLLFLTSPAAAEVFVLTDGGRVSGDLLNPKESPRKQYIIQTADGAKVTLDAGQVQKVLRLRPEEVEYERIAPTYPDTAADQWKLAQWCFEHKLTAQRRTHLRRVIELDPNHAKARYALGYSQIDGRWTTQEETMISQGYVRSNGKWVLPQEAELAANKLKSDAEQQEWCKKLKRWRGWLGGNRDQEARDGILAITDPMAVRGLALGLRDDDSEVRILFVKALAKIDSPEAAKILAKAAIEDRVDEVRQSCLDYLEAQKRPELTPYFVGKLRDKNNVVVNLAGVALSRVKDPAAVPALIDAVITTHKFKIAKAGGDNSMSSSFSKGGSGGAGLSMGGGPKIISQNILNQAVLDALVAITGQNFNFDKQAWKHWYASQKKAPKSLDVRRN